MPHNDLHEKLLESLARETEKGMNHTDSPENEKARYTAAVNAAIQDSNRDKPLPDPCAKTQLGKIQIALHNFFTTLKGIRKYADLYVNGTINKIQNITNLIRSTSQIIGAVLKTLITRLRDFLLDKIRRGIEDLIDLLLPAVAKSIKNTIIQQVIDNIFCKFKDVIKGLVNLVGDFLFELIGKVVNVPFCAAQQFTNALINNVAAIVDSAVGPVLKEINNLLGGVGKIVGNVFQALDYIIGLENFPCAAPNCPEITKFKASPWAGPSQQQIDDFGGFLAPLGGRQTPTAESIIASATDYIDGIEIFGSKLGDSVGSTSSEITTCNTQAFRCGAPKVTFFGGGGAGAVGEAVVDNVGKTIGVNLRYGGMGYSRPPFVTFEDSCESTFLSGYTVINDAGEVIDVVIRNPTASPPNDGRTEFDPPSDQIGEIPRNDYVVCLYGFRILDTGIGYTINDSIEIDPDVPNLNASVKLTEDGQIIAIELAEPVCGIQGYPEITINSDTGLGAVIQPILTFIPINEFDDVGDVGDGELISVDLDSEIKAEISTNNREGLITTLRGRKLITEKQEFTRRDVIRIVDCIT